MKKLYQKPITEVVTVVQINSAIMIGSNGTPSIPVHKANITELETYMSNANFQFEIQGKISVSWKEMKKRMELNYGK